MAVRWPPRSLVKSTFGEPVPIGVVEFANSLTLRKRSVFIHVLRLRSERAGVTYLTKEGGSHE